MIDLADALPTTTSDEAVPARYPIVVHRMDGFLTVHSCSFEALRADLPTDHLHPLRLPNGRAMLSFALYHKREISAGAGPDRMALRPYAELMVMAVVAPRPMSRLASLQAMAGLGRAEWGGFALHLPLTDRSWRDGGRAAMGMPMFVADFDLAIDDRRQRLRVSEDGSEIVTIAVRSGGMLTQRHDTQSAYAALGGRLLAAPGETATVAQVRLGGARLRLGRSHPVATDLRRLDVAPRAVFSFTYHAGRGVLGEPVEVGKARPRPCHPGLDVALGRWDVRYEGAVTRAERALR